MVRFRRAAIAALGVLAFASCTTNNQPASDTAAATASAPDAAADEQAVRAINQAWFTAYIAGDAEGVITQYSDDAVVSPPGAATVRGKAAIREYFSREVPALATTGFTYAPGQNSEMGVSGDLAWETNTFAVSDKSGKVLETGKYVSVFARRDGKWAIIRDIWNMDAPPAPTS